jgi:hypothetical protein
MDVDGGMVIAVEEKRIALLFENLRHRPSVPDCGLGARLRRGMIAGLVPGRGSSAAALCERRSGGPRGLLRFRADCKVSRFLSRFLPDPRVCTENTTVVTNPPRGAFFAWRCIGSHGAATNMPPALRACLRGAFPGCFAVLQEPQTRCHDGETIEPGAEQATKIGTIEGQ